MGDALFPALGNGGGYDVSHYALALDYVPETNRLKGTATITARATQGLSRFNLDLAGLTVRTVTVDGTRARFTRKKNELTLTPTRAIENGEVFEAAITYDGTPKMIEGSDGGTEGWIETDDGATALGEPTGSMTWFPGNHHPSDKATYDITVSVPKDEDGDPYDVVSNGELKREEDTGRRVTRRWSSDEPMASYLANVAVGYFEIHKGLDLRWPARLRRRRSRRDGGRRRGQGPGARDHRLGRRALRPVPLLFRRCRRRPPSRPRLCAGDPDQAVLRLRRTRCWSTSSHTSGSATRSLHAGGRTCG
ncbi:hypothetical protein AB0B67_14180 [Streptomyces spectabilis]|uniref:Aminopeptidase N-like N-terminal domain-containing protein n=1 Tax=Streptomyces spectabilis TaxID=68270 RepID=A0A7W8B2L6_STRST|nr:hypothetical protein [Streptomyces spectabilis]MBB5108020.1 hypothetical protein [Streptomyces spectabilis]